jgi:hypothetical protein
VGRTLLSAAFDLDFGYAKQIRDLGNEQQYRKQKATSKAADRTCPEQPRRECPPHTKNKAPVSAGALKLLNLLK